MEARFFYNLGNEYNETMPRQQSKFEKVVGLFFSGFVGAFLILIFELEYFGLFQAGAALPNFDYFSLVFIIFTMINFAESFLVGLLAPIAFSVGFLVGTLAILYYCWASLSALGGVLVDLCIGFTLVLIGLLLKLKRMRERGQGNYYKSPYYPY